MTMSNHVTKNRTFWDRSSDAYQRDHGTQLDWRKPPGWGVWSIPESSLQILGDVSGLDVLELGCGAAQWSIALQCQGARVVALDVSARQLEHARRLMHAAGADFPLLCANAEEVPLPDESFDVVFCDHGAMTFADPYKTVPEARRLLRAGGLFAFNIATPILELCFNPATNAVETCLQQEYFHLHSIEDKDSVNFQLPYGAWIRLFRQSALIIEDLIELQPAAEAETTYSDFVSKAWARRWPAEHIWKVRRASGEALLRPASRE